MNNDSSIIKFIRIIMPLIVIEIVEFAVTFFATLFLTAYVSTPSTGELTEAYSFYNYLFDKVAEHSLLITLISSGIVILLCYRSMRKDDFRRDYRIVFKSIPKWSFILCIAIGFLFCLGLNMVSACANVTEFSDTVMRVNEIIYSSNMIMRVATVGIVAPIAEECIFRGLIYRRLRDYTRFVPAILVSAFLFAIYHGNIIQGIYGFFLGLVFAAVYEKTGSIVAPIIVHVAANLTSIIMSEVMDVWPEFPVMVVIAVVTLAITLIMIRIIWKKVKPEVIYIQDILDEVSEDASDMDDLDNQN